MHTFLVWDALNSEASEAGEYQAHSPVGAAEAYANSDSDGATDGLYDADGTELRVRDEQGTECGYMVAWVDHPPSWVEQLCEGAVLRAVKLVV